jgi:hypothetical protein
MSGYAAPLHEPGTPDTDLLQKPFTEHTLLDCVEEVLDAG